MSDTNNHRSVAGLNASGACCALGLAILLVSGDPVSAQSALGDGRALDANLQQGRGGINPMGRDIVSELRLRNAIVTGNVPGGFAFRGDVGYTAAGDFAGGLGEDDIFAFQRDSIMSSIGMTGQPLRGVDALRLQMEMSIGGQIDARMGMPIVRMPGGGVTPADLLADSAGFRGDFSGLTFDPFTLRPGTLRSTSDYFVGQVLSPRVLGQGQLEQDGPALFSVATPLRGVTLDEAPTYVRPIMPLDEADRRAIERIAPDPPQDREGVDRSGRPAPRPGEGDRPDAIERPDARIEREDVTGRVQDSRIEPGRVTDRVEPQRQDYRGVIEALRRAERSLTTPVEDDDEARRPPLDPTEEIIDRWAPEFARDAEDLGVGEDAPAADGRRVGDVVPIPELEQTPDFDRRIHELSAKLQLPSAMLPDGRAASRPGRDDPARVLDRGELIREAEDLLGRITPRIESLSPPAGPERNLFAEHMRAGERALGDRRWFDAEERFTTALRIQPGDAMAVVGRVNAQIGSGMFRSGAINLQQLFRTNPELIGVRYAENLLIDADRHMHVRGQLRRIIQRDDDMGRSAAILLAYLGYQFDRPADVREAFAAVDRVTRELGDEPDPLYQVLRAVWLRGQQPPADRGK